ncbi:MAG: ATP-dependent zinc protease [Lishizhenia sp.]
MKSHKKQHVIGKSDRADFPIFNLKNIKVKVDTGAYTSSIHCSKIEEIEDKLHVIFLSETCSNYTGETIIFHDYEIKKVRSSSGKSQMRFKVKANIILFGETFNTEFTLSDRSKMKFPVLLGRKLLNKHFLVNTSVKNQSYQITNTQND